MRLAIIADIHSNYPALEAVLNDIQTQNVDEIIVAGDAVNAAPFPRQVMDAIYAHGWPMVRGNHEQYMLDCHDPDCEDYPPEAWQAFYWTLARLTERDLAFFRDLPEAIERDDLVIMHGAPGYLNWGILPSTPDDTLADLYGALPQRAIVTAHTHIPFVIHWRDKTIINPGAVGMSFDSNPAASYAILTRVAGRFIVQHRRVPYDLAALQRAAEETGFLEDGGLFARNFLVQMVNARPQSRSLIRQIEELQARHGISLVEAIARADLSLAEPDLDYTFARRRSQAASRKSLGDVHLPEDET